MKRCKALLMLFLLTKASAWAGYRVYQLKVTPFDLKGKAQKTRVVLSTLDPNQYQNYAGFGLLKVELADSWYCPGDTGHFRKYCSKPKEPTRVPASLERNKRIHLPVNLQPIIP
ncbi:MAG: hypothetical protein HY537_01250 [Deltaproteobacteria bacterium]|nr:hypothetical protein [Deltaproteobacteria bacterium]